MLAFRNLEADGFVGEISDPMPVSWAADGSGLMAGRSVAGPGQSPAAAGYGLAGDQGPARLQTRISYGLQEAP